MGLVIQPFIIAKSTQSRGKNKLPSLCLTMLDIHNNQCSTFFTPPISVLPSIHLYMESDTTLFPSCCFEEPSPIVIDKGNEEYYIKQILDACQCGQGYLYLVCWCSYGQEHDKWLLDARLQECKALDT